MKRLTIFLILDPAFRCFITSLMQQDSEKASDKSLLDYMFRQLVADFSGLPSPSIPDIKLICSNALEGSSHEQFSQHR